MNRGERSAYLPRRVDLGLLLEAMPGLAGEFRREVPKRFWRRQHERKIAVICACKRRFKMEIGRVQSCPGECGRWFIGTERTLRVAGPYAEEPPPPASFSPVD